MSPDAPAWLDRVAHDLRGPLMPLQTAAYLLRSGQLEPARQAELVDVIERQTRQLARMIDELGDWLRAGQQRLLGQHEPCDPALLLDTASVGAGLSPPRVRDLSGGAQVAGDPQRLAQLLRILLQFAQVHGAGATTAVTLARDDGHLRLDCVFPRTPATPAAATLLARPEDQPFDGGLGLQLLLGRAIAEAHGGTLQADEDDGKLRLRCRLPLAGTGETEPGEGSRAG